MIIFRSAKKEHRDINDKKNDMPCFVDLTL